MKRREFITLLSGAAASWPLAAGAQQQQLPVIGILSSRSRATDALLLAVIRQGLNDTGFVEGRNVSIEYRWAEGNYNRLAALAADLVGHKVAVIVTIGGDVAALAAKAAPPPYPWSLRSQRIQSAAGWSPACIDPAAISPVTARL